MAIGSNLFTKQKPAREHLVRPGAGLSGEIDDLRSDVGRVLEPLAALVVEEFLSPPGADRDAIKLSFASSTAALVLEGAALDGAVGTGVMDPPRNVTVTVSGTTPADAPATLTVEGEDVRGEPVSEAVNVPQTASSASTVRALRRVRRVLVGAGDGTGALLQLGFGNVMGLGRKLKLRAGAPAVLVEIEDGASRAADALTGTFTSPALSLPNGTYLPDQVPDGTRSYALYYELDEG